MMRNTRALSAGELLGFKILELGPENSKSRVSFRFLTAAAALCIFVPGLVSAKLAVFVDGRVMKVQDARLEGEDIVLELSGGGRLSVPAVRIDRVIGDEIEEDEISDPIGDPSCPLIWTDEPLPRDLPYRKAITEAARTADLDPWLVVAVVRAESAFDPLARSRAGAAGLMQLMPAAAADHRVSDVFDPAENLRGGSAHLRAMLDRFGSLPLALAAYNAGAATVERYQGIPPFKETRRYIRAVLEVFCPEG